MKKKKLNISKLNLNKEIISNLSEVKGGEEPSKNICIESNHKTDCFCISENGTCDNQCEVTAKTSELQQCCW